MTLQYDEDEYLDRQERLVEFLLFFAAVACALLVGAILGIDWAMGKMGW